MIKLKKFLSSKTLVALCIYLLGVPILVMGTLYGPYWLLMLTLMVLSVIALGCYFFSPKPPLKFIIKPLINLLPIALTLWILFSVLRMGYYISYYLLDIIINY